MRIDDEHDLGAPARRTGQELQFGGADHGGLVDDDRHRTCVDVELVVVDGDRPPIRITVRGGAQRFQRVCFARAGPRLQRLQQISGALAMLTIVSTSSVDQVTQITVADIQVHTVVSRIDHLKDALRLSYDRVHREPLMAFGDVRRAALPWLSPYSP